MKPLHGKVALVAGATRGAGRGIAAALGEAGATVYCTGRSVRGAGATPGRAETIDETAEIVTSNGGVGIAVQVDHTVAAQVEALIGRIRTEQSRLDILVNDVWGGDTLTEFGKTFWEVDIEKGRLMFERAVFSHIITSRYAGPLLIETGDALIVEITDGETYTYRGNIFYDLVKTSTIRLALAMARELRRKRVAAVAVTPGFLRSEAMLEKFGVTAETWRDAAATRPDFLASETPVFVGRAVAALAADPDIMKKSGRVFSSWQLSDEYGFTDVDGSRPHWGRHFESKYGKIKTCDDTFYSYLFGGAMDLVFPDWP